MRHLVLALMIVLLPLRGWAGDAMATQMAGATLAMESAGAGVHNREPAATLVHQSQVVGATEALSDCHEQLAGQSGIDNSPENYHCGTCQACHTVALSPSPFEVMASFASPQLRPTHAAAFTSVASALGQKPPIS